MSEAAIKVEHVSKDFVLPHERNTSIKQAFVNPFRTSMHKNVKRQHALKDVSFEVKKGEFFGIVGRNGSGKSTLLKMIAGIYQPTKGRIKVNGKLVPFIELGVGFNPELTGRQNVYLNGALLGFSKKEVGNMYDDIVEFAELKDFMDQKLKNYSSGMQVRLAFSMAVRAKADTLLIDEVLAVGDADFQRKCFDYFRQLKRNNKTVIFVSHDMEAVRKYCDRAILISDNKIKDEGTAEKIAQAYIRQFNGVEEQEFKLQETDRRWGDGRVKTTDIKVIQGKDDLTFKQTISATEDVPGIIAGIRIKNSAGEHVLGTNTKLERTYVPPLKARNPITISWTIPNLLSDGKFFVDTAIHHQDETSVADWFDDAAEFKIRKQRTVPYSVDPEFKVVVNNG